MEKCYFQSQFSFISFLQSRSFQPQAFQDPVCWLSISPDQTQLYSSTLWISQTSSPGRRRQTRSDEDLKIFHDLKKNWKHSFRDLSSVEEKVHCAA